MKEKEIPEEKKEVEKEYVFYIFLFLSLVGGLVFVTKYMLLPVESSFNLWKIVGQRHIILLWSGLTVLVFDLTCEWICKFPYSKQNSRIEVNDCKSPIDKTKIRGLEVACIASDNIGSEMTEIEVLALKRLLFTQVIDTALFLDSTLTLSKVANLLNVDKSTLIRYFEQSEARTFKKYISRLRIEYAIHIIQIKEKDITVEELTILCGFNTRLSFYRAFVHFYGFAPSELLK
ncbi:helix-turn-helix transcriptional regulator [Myroides sp. 1354]|uniref:helix-turn-helix domain-containing protein n=1 Tax=unclassified Myroides TaxID=2642485 RepID=UPI002574F367|nr:MULTISPECIES: AraC family transcriptional regulator [unclassified Myroides]MDM1046327.1 helix-turn-helix transcriptional regulator [Myroides sp. R163-1]MDM1057264.1 helix-turn-helix transcriptional regulator [Myroides sp. 1354]MDM1070501.1 helix-turn-helix transcriptional regulator [Myroides sp. 1372]